MENLEGKQRRTGVFSESRQDLVKPAPNSSGSRPERIGLASKQALKIFNSNLNYETKKRLIKGLLLNGEVTNELP